MGDLVRVCLVAPTCADSAVPFGGGERYVEELARALAERCEVRLVSFAKTGRRERVSERLERVILRSWTRDPITPLAPGLFRELRGFDVIHAFQYYTLPTFLACWWGRHQGSRVFVTDLGGGGWTPGYQIDQSRWIDGHLPISEYAASLLPERSKPYAVIYGGVDLEKFRMRPRAEHDGSVVFLGRILPHKGIHNLIEAMPAGRRLRVIGPPADREYLTSLHRKASGKTIDFEHGLGDQEVVERLQSAMVQVHPTPEVSSGSAGVHELLGLAVLEGMACGCPVIVPSVASLPELIGAGDEGIVVSRAEPELLGRAIGAVAADESRWFKRSLAARERVADRFTWSTVTARCMENYRTICSSTSAYSGEPQC